MRVCMMNIRNHSRAFLVFVFNKGCFPLRGGGRVAPLSPFVHNVWSMNDHPKFFPPCGWVPCTPG